MAAYLTNKGLEVLNKLMASKGTLNIIRAELGDGTVTGEDACRAQTSLANKVCDATFCAAKYQGGEAKLSVQYKNDGLETGFFVREVGIYVQDPTSGNAVLYTYATFGDTPDWIAPASSTRYTRVYDVTTIIANVSNVNVTISPSAMVAVEEFDVAMGQIDVALAAIVTEGDARLRSLEAGDKTLDQKIEGNYDTLDGKIDDTKDDVEADIATCLTNAKAYTDQLNALIDLTIQSVIAQYDPLVRDLRARVKTLETQVSALT